VEPCAGVDTGDGFDCYGQPVFGASGPVVPYYSESQKAALWGRLTGGEPLTLTEIAAIRAGLFGQPGVARLNERGISPLPTVNVTAAAPSWLVLALLFFLFRRT